MGWIMGDDGAHRCPPLPFLFWPREGRTATCEDCGQKYVVERGRWVRRVTPAKPSNRTREEIVRGHYDD